MSDLLHRLAHRLGWQRGRVVSWTTSDYRIIVAFKCSRCGRVTDAFDATRNIDAELDDALAALEETRPEHGQIETMGVGETPGVRRG